MPERHDYEIRELPQRSRFELHQDQDLLVAWVDYHDNGPVRTITSTVVIPEQRGQGHAHSLISYVLEDALAHGRKIIPLCWVAAGEIRKNPDRYLRLLPDAQRAVFSSSVDASGRTAPSESHEGDHL